MLCGKFWNSKTAFERCLLQENVEDRGRLRRCRCRWWSLLPSMCVTSSTRSLIVPLWSQTTRRPLEIWARGTPRYTDNASKCHLSPFCLSYDLHAGGMCVCVCFQDIHKINTSWHAKDQTAPQDFSFEFPCLLAGNSWVDGSSLVSESVALGDIWQNLLPRFAYKLPHPPAAMSQPPKNQHHMWLPLEFPHTHLLELGNEEAINILSIRPHRRPTVRLTNSCERTALPPHLI